MKHFITKSAAKFHLVKELRGAALDHAETILWIRGGRFIPFRDEALIEDYLRGWCQRQDMQGALRRLDWQTDDLAMLIGSITTRAMSSLMCNDAA